MAGSGPPEGEIAQPYHYLSSDEERFEYVTERIRDKLADYDGYDFSMVQVRALNIFFELSQELRGRQMFYAVCMMLPRILFDLDSAIYILEDEETFSLAGTSGPSSVHPSTRGWDEVFREHPVQAGDTMFIPIPCNPGYTDLLPFEPPHNIIGNFQLSPCRDLPGHVQLFLEKYVNRIGFQLHHRIIRARNREHITFIKNLVQDIGHNVIVPNMYFKLYFNRLQRGIKDLHLQVQEVLALMAECGSDDCIRTGNSLARTTAGIEAQYQEIYRHYEATSMFLETLLRQRHFEEGRYVLEKHAYNLRTHVLEPQLERYAQSFEDRGIQVGCALGGPPDQVVRVVMDRGLISQVVANFFSNAVKYTEEGSLPDGSRGKHLSYGWKIIKDFFGKGVPAVKVWVTTTGAPLKLDDPMTVFQPGFRADNVQREEGSGRGLYFVRQVVELHHGKVGYSHRNGANEFHFILPLVQFAE